MTTEKDPPAGTVLARCTVCHHNVAVVRGKVKAHTYRPTFRDPKCRCPGGAVPAAPAIEHWIEWRSSVATETLARDASRRAEALSRFLDAKREYEANVAQYDGYARDAEADLAAIAEYRETHPAP